jgi:hypothetical protein
VCLRVSIWRIGDHVAGEANTGLREGWRVRGEKVGEAKSKRQSKKGKVQRKGKEREEKVFST